MSLAKTAAFLEMIKVSHTVFALPFALGASFLAAGGMPSFPILGKIILCVLFARTAAMAFNRIADRHIDGRNPRTAERALPAGTLSVRFAVGAALLSLAGFVATAAWINPLALKLSPIAIAVVLGYSLTKRFTFLCHVVLGAALALAPVGAWVAVRGELAMTPWVLGGAVLLWTAGFDILYACMDVDFDRKEGLHSIPARLGVRRSLWVAATLHAGMVGSLFWLWTLVPLGGVFLAALIGVLALLVYEHSIVRPHDLSRVNRAFFTTNGVISFALMVALIVEATRG